MNILIDLLMELVGWFFPSLRADQNRSIVGESRMDRSAKTWSVIAVVVLALISAGVWVWSR